MPDWKSQARQDEAVYRILRGRPGTFFDVGSHDPIRINNTVCLEQQGWTGYLFDCDPRWAEPSARLRTSPFLCADVSTFDWRGFLTAKGITRIDYLSFDVDEASLVTLRRFPFDQVSFQVCTIEHDRYRFGEAVATEMRDILGRHGYTLLCKDVCNQGNPYEDWYVAPALAPAAPLPLCSGLEWTECLKTLRTHYPDPSLASPERGASLSEYLRTE